MRVAHTINSAFRIVGRIGEISALWVADQNCLRSTPKAVENYAIVATARTGGGWSRVSQSGVGI